LFKIRQDLFYREYRLEQTRKRAPSARSLETKKRILDGAEKIFADKGYDGATLRNIAGLAKVPVGLVHHHGHSKEDLFCQTVRRRADHLSKIRIQNLEELKSRSNLTLHSLLDCFFRAFVNLVEQDGEHWQSYGRLVAHVSANPRWRSLAEECFDPTAKLFLHEISLLYPNASQLRAATGQIYAVAALLAFFNSTWRIETLGGVNNNANIDELVTFCSAGMDALLNK